MNKIKLGALLKELGLPRLSLRGFLTGLVCFTPLAPLSFAYLLSNHLGFALYGMSKLFCALYVLVFLAGFPGRLAPSRVPLSGSGKWAARVALAAGYILAFVSFLAGFSVYGLFAGIAGLIFFRHFYYNEGRNFSQNLHRSMAWALVLAMILLPVLNLELVGLFRRISMFGVDTFLGLLGIEYERVGITYFFDARQVLVEERCSGASSTRVFLIIFATLFLRRRAYFSFWALSAPLAICAGLTVNTSRISLHILLTLWRGAPPEALLHEALGMFCFLLVLVPILLNELWIIDAGSIYERTDDVLEGVVPGDAVQESMLPASGKVNFGFSVVVASALVLLLGTNLWIYFEYEKPKKLDHELFEGPSLNGAWIREYRFVERRGGGGWIMLEHPIEYCMALRGWNADAQRMTLNRRGRVLELRTAYIIGAKRYRSRIRATFMKWLNPAAWNAPLEVEVRFEESIRIPAFFHKPVEASPGSENTTEVYGLEYARSKFPGARVSRLLRNRSQVEFNWMFYLVKLGERRILIDTGFRDISRRSSFKVYNYTDPLTLLERLGIRPEDISDVFLTHGHFDHLGLVAAFPRATVYIQQKEFQYLSRSGAGVDVQKFLRALKAQGVLRTLSGDHTFEGELKSLGVLFSGGHTPGHQVISLKQGEKTFFFMGDECYRRLDCQAGRALPGPVAFNHKRNRLFLEKIKKIPGAVFLPLHDPALMKDYPGVGSNRRIIRIFP